MNAAAVIIPTLRRPDSLARAVRSALAQQDVEGRLAEIVVVDNDPAGSARPVVEALASGAATPVRYVHAPKPGVATARNAGLAATDAPLIAFLDDDEAASPGWLAALLAARERLGCDVVFGPIAGRAPDAEPWLRPYLERFFGRAGPGEDALLDHAFGCGNALLLRATALPGPAPFDPEADQAGGEDDALFAALAARGGRFGWAADAWVEEFAPAHRATLAYALRRAFAYGQGPSQTAAKQRRPLALLRWMVIGAGQAAVYGAVALACWLARRPARAEWSDRAVRGLGKLFWMKVFEPQFYGAAELARSARA